MRHEDAVGQRHQQREQPDGHDDGRARRHLHARLKRVDDHEEAVDGDRGERQRRDVHARALRVRHQVAQHWPKNPLPLKHTTTQILHLFFGNYFIFRSWEKTQPKKKTAEKII